MDKDEYLLRKVTLKGAPREFYLPAKDLLIRPQALNGALLAVYNFFNGEGNGYKEKPVNLGEPPVLYSQAEAHSAVRRLEEFFISKGFFRVKASFSVKKNAQKRSVALHFLVIPGPRATIHPYSYAILDPSLRKLYTNSYAKSWVQAGDFYDQANFDKEATDLVHLFNNSGYKDFTKNYITFEVDTTFSVSEAAVKMQIANPKKGGAHVAYTINNTYIKIDYPDQHDVVSTPRTQDISMVEPFLYLIDPLNKFDKARLAEYNFLQKGSLYSLDNYLKTYNRLVYLGPFQSVDIQFRPLKEDSTKLNVYARLTAYKPHELSLNTEYSHSGGNNIALAVNYVNRNSFKSFARLYLGLKGVKSYYKLDGEPLTVEQLELSSSLLFPHLDTFFKIHINRDYIPQTAINLNFAYVSRPELTYYSYSYVHRFDFATSYRNIIALAPISFGYMSSNLNKSFLDTLISHGNYEAASQLQVRYQSYVLLSSQLFYTHNSDNLYKRLNFIYYRFGLESAGNLAWILSKILSLSKNQNGSYLIANRPFSQYIKPEVDFRVYKNIFHNSQLVMRANLAFGIPYLNSKVLPFNKQYSTGGANSIRAWGNRSLGPGSFNLLSLSQDVRNLLLNQQYGDIKLEFNLETRFPLIKNFFARTNRLEGALFIDAGNIWLAAPNQEFFTSSEAIFYLNSFYKQIALGAGAGLRFNFSAMVFRIDLAVKLYDPQIAEGTWVIFKKLSADQAATHYSKLAVNFGIGYPF